MEANGQLDLNSSKQLQDLKDEISKKEMLLRYKFTITDVSEYIDLLLKYPSKFLNFPNTTTDDAIKRKFSEICNAIQKQLNNFPFLLVIDEAQILSKIEYNLTDGNETNLKATAFQLFRRALSYLKPGTPFFVLALGTKSLILDIMPTPVIHVPIQRRTLWAPPIVLSGNFDIHKHDEGMSYLDFTPTYELLKNPIVFKLLVSMGSPIWSSEPFSGIIDLATTKHEDVFAAWMIRTGMFANPNS